MSNKVITDWRSAASAPRFVCFGINACGFMTLLDYFPRDVLNTASDCFVLFLCERRMGVWLGVGRGERRNKRLEDQTESDRHSDRGALPRTPVINVLSLIVNSSRSLMYYPVHIISSVRLGLLRCTNKQ